MLGRKHEDLVAENLPDSLLSSGFPSLRDGGSEDPRGQVLGGGELLPEGVVITDTTPENRDTWVQVLQCCRVQVQPCRPPRPTP